jgi:oligopeptide transport system permease protein
MIIKLLKYTSIFSFILIGFILLLLLPREKEIEVFSSFHIEASYPFSVEKYVENMDEFILHFQTEKGFGISSTGESIREEAKLYVTRSLKIILPAFFISMGLGILLGVLQFYHRDRKRGKISAFLFWVFSSIPDFFLYISIQYLLIKLIRLGLPHIHLFGHEQWYSFIIPLISLIIFPLTHMVKFTSTTLENEMGREYIRTVYAKGLGHVKALLHMLWNCWPAILNQAQLTMLYILTSLPIIEKLSGYNGAGKELLGSILRNDEIRSLALMLPFLLLMFAIIVLSQSLKYYLMPIEVEERE